MGVRRRRANGTEAERERGNDTGQREITGFRAIEVESNNFYRQKATFGSERDA